MEIKDYVIITSVGSESWTKILETKIAQYIDSIGVEADTVLLPFYNRAHESANILAGKEKFVNSLSGFRFELTHDEAISEFISIRSLHSVSKWGAKFIEDIKTIRLLSPGTPSIIIVNDIAHKEEHLFLKKIGAVSIEIGGNNIGADFSASCLPEMYSEIADDFINNYLGTNIKNLKV